MRRCRRFLQPTDRRVMIAKILKHSKSFAGIEYNRLKTENGKAEMLEAKNFELEAMVGLTGQPSAATYLDFQNYVSDRRPDVNYRQFHAVISCAGRELSKEQLLDAARIYIDKMGYGDQPYLVFFHKDTDNNHVHIVSTRVRYDGSLVSDKSERYRSLAAIREINRQFNISESENLQVRAKKDIAAALEWRFAFDSNLVGIFKEKGYKLEKSQTVAGRWILSSDGEMCGTITQDQIDACKKAYKEGVSVRVNGKLPVDKQPKIFKRKQLLFKKLTEYASKGYTFEEIKSLHELRTQLGFHIESTTVKDKEGKEHIRWSVTDYPGKTVYRSSDVFPIETLVRSTDFSEKADHFYSLVNQVLAEEGKKCGWRRFAERMSALGYTMHTGKGNVAYATRPGENGQYHLPADTVAALNYNQRVINVSAMDIHSEEEARCLAAINRVKVDDIRPVQLTPEDKSVRKVVRETLSSLLHNLSGEDLSAALKKEGVSVVLMGKELFFYHPQGGLYNVSKLGGGFTVEQAKGLDLNVLDVDRMNRYYSRWEDYLNEKTVTYPEPPGEEQQTSGNTRGTGQNHSRSAVSGGASGRRTRARDYDDSRTRSASPSMDAVLKPISLAGFLAQMAQIANQMKAGGGGGGGGRSRKRKRRDDDENED